MPVTKRVSLGADAQAGLEVVAVPRGRAGVALVARLLAERPGVRLRVVMRGWSERRARVMLALGAEEVVEA